MSLASTQVDSSHLKPSQRTRYSHFPYTMDSSMLLLTPIAAIANLFYFLVHVNYYQYLLVWSSGRPTSQRGNSPLAAESHPSRTQTEDEGGWYSSWQGSGTDQQLRLSLAYGKTHAVDTCVRAYVLQLTHNCYCCWPLIIGSVVANSNPRIYCVT